MAAHVEFAKTATLSPNFNTFTTPETSLALESSKLSNF